MTMPGTTQLDAIPVKIKAGRASKGVRKHHRRMKQEARKAGIPETGSVKRKRAA